MKKSIIVIVFLLCSQLIFAQNEVEPDGDKLVWILLFILIATISFFIFRKSDKKTGSAKIPFIQFKRVKIELEKDRLYYPDNLKLTVKNSSNTDLDLDQPLLIFDNFWLKRKFRLKGIGNRSFYPLYFEKGKTHSLQIDLNRFYSHDKSIKKFPKAKIILYDVKGKRLGSKSVFLRKTLFNF